jgi:hypothetical protein
LSPVVAIPWTKYFCRVKNRIKQGSIDNTDMANMDPQDDIPDESRKSLSPMGTVYLPGELRYKSWLKKSSQVHRKVNNTVVISAGRLRGITILI